MSIKKYMLCSSVFITTYTSNHHTLPSGQTTISFTINTAATNNTSQEQSSSVEHTVQKEPTVILPVVKNYKPIALYVTAAVGISTLGTLWIVYFWYHHAINSKKNWSAWYNYKTLEQVYQLELEGMKKEFIEALRKRYAPFSPRPHLGHTLFNFEKDILEEITMLNNYLSFHQFVKKTYLYLLLPGQNSLRLKTLENLQRLDFLQHLANKVSAVLIDN